MDGLRAERPHQVWSDKPSLARPLLNPPDLLPGQCPLPARSGHPAQCLAMARGTATVTLKGGTDLNLYRAGLGGLRRPLAPDKPTATDPA